MHRPCCWVTSKDVMLQVSTVLDRKEALLLQLRTMNDEAETGMHVDSSGRHTEAFQAAYAKVVLELKQARSLLTSGCSELFDTLATEEGLEHKNRGPVSTLLVWGSPLLD